MSVAMGDGNSGGTIAVGDGNGSGGEDGVTNDDVGDNGDGVTNETTTTIVTGRWTMTSTDPSFPS